MIDVCNIGQVVASISNPNAGTTYAVVHLAESLEEHGCRSPVYCVGSPAPGLPEISVRSFELSGFGLPGRMLQVSRGFREGLRCATHEVLHVHGLWFLPGHYAALAARKAHSKLVISPHGMLAPWSLKHHRWRKRAVWHLWQGEDLKGADALHVTSEQEAEDCRRVGYSGPIAVVPMGVQVPDCEQLGQRGKQVVFLGRLHRVKGLELLIPAWASLEKRFPLWTLVVAGPDADGSGKDAQRAATTCGCSRVEFRPALNGEEKGRLLHESLLFVLPSYTENFGIAVVEAMAHGLPVITTTGTPWRELAIRKIGWWVEPTVDAIAEALSEAMSLPESTLADMGEKGRRWMVDEYSWGAVGAEMKKVYKWLVGGGARPSCIRVT